MWWKIYFWIVLVVTILSLPTTLPYLNDVSAILSLVLNLGILIGTYSYVYGKQILRPRTWKLLFWLTVVSWIFNLGYTFSEDFRQTFGYMEAVEVNSQLYEIIGTLLTIPALYAVYRLAFKTR